MKFRNWLFGLAGAVILSACVTTQPPSEPGPPPVVEVPGPVVPEITEPSVPETTVPETPTPTSPPVEGPEPTEPLPISNSAFGDVSGWGEADMRGALKAFQRSCSILDRSDAAQYLTSSRPDFGQISDWQGACALAQATPAQDNQTARQFFESEFLPVDISAGDTETSLVTGYYQPEIQVRRTKDEIYSEPILGVPQNTAVLEYNRSQIDESHAKVLAYARPIEVFFMQIQGSGVMVFSDGSRQRAAYAANNGKPYTSIGRVLINRGELTKDQSSKQNIEDWMVTAGPEKARALMNENKRYIFFKPETILPGEGPKGAMQAPLTEMASIAIDPAHYPYGLPVWLETTLPNGKGDYKGTPQSLLVIAQDTGKAIRGERRADLYFGSGDAAGDKAGVMKHPARWTILLPFHLALAFAPVS